MRIRSKAAVFLAAAALFAACSDRGPVVPSAALMPQLQINASPTGVRISEIHYDNAGADVGEGVEISGPAGTDLTGWKVVSYNGNGGAAYDTKTLSGLIPATPGCGVRGVVTVAVAGLQNGAPDGVALIDASNAVVEFLSYEGTFTAVGGAANGIVSTDIGVVEVGTEAAGLSLQRGGASGGWTGPVAATLGTCNDNGAQPVVDHINVAPVAPSIQVGATQQFTATAFDASNQPIPGVTFTWSSGTPATATISSTGLATGAAVGTSVITATSGSVSGTSTLTVTAAQQVVVDRVVVSPVDPSIVLGATVQFSARAFDAANVDVSGSVAFVWSSGTAATASVSAAGLATGLAAGSSVISATAGGKTGTSTLTVTVPNLPPTRFTEIHYDNAGTDVNERIEIEGPAGTDLTGWSVILYNGNGGASYDTFSLTGTIPATCGARGVVVVSYLQDGIQNGKATNGTGQSDGFALVNGAGQVVEFLSYEGTLVATSGPANGTTSVDIGVLEDGVPLAQSLHRNAGGIWQSASLADFGACNSGGGTPLSNNSVSFTGRLTTDQFLPVGFQDQLFANVRDASGTAVSTTITWSSLTPSVASIDATTGVMTSLAAGSARFRATGADGSQGDYVLPMDVATPSALVYAGNTAFGEPTDADPSDDFLIRRREFTSSYSRIRNTPNYVAYQFDATHVGAGADRCDCFTFDPTLPSSFPRYTTADYTGAGAFAGFGIDRGHLARSFDLTAGTLDNASSFLFSNIIPQAASVNQGPWAKFENFLGNEATANNREVYIIAGVAGKLAGPNGTVKGLGLITVPAYVWKVAVILPRDQGLADVVNGTEPTVVAVVMPNDPSVSISSDWPPFQVTVDSVEALSGYNVLALLPDFIETQLEKGNRFPTARSGGAYTGVEGTALAFNGATSTDPDAGDVLTYAWSFGDGTVGTGATPTKSYVNNGVYTVTLTVTDQGGASSTSTTTATISNAAPVVTLTPAASWKAGIASSIGVKFSDLNSKDSPFIVRINWGDGTALTQFASTVVPVTPFARPHVYASAGSYTVTVTVTDRDGGVGTQTLSVTVQP